MNDEEFNEEMKEDNIEEEMERAQDKVPKAKKNAQPEEEVVEQSFETFYQPERIGIKDSRTGEPIAEGFKEEDAPTLMALEKIINMLEKISIASGAQ